MNQDVPYSVRGPLHMLFSKLITDHDPVTPTLGTAAHFVANCRFDILCELMALDDEKADDGHLCEWSQQAPEHFVELGELLQYHGAATPLDKFEMRDYERDYR